MKGTTTISTRVKQALFAAFFVIILLTYMQHKFIIADLSPLEGYVETTTQPNFTVSSWFDGTYQKEKEKHINENIGFRPVLIRLRNQLMFSLFRETSSHIVIGKDDYLYEENYIKAYLGRDFTGKDSIDDKVYKLRKIQDTLASLNIHFGVILAAGKGTFFPQYIPERFNPATKTLTNYQYYKEKFVEKGINHIDFNAWFLAQKDTSTYPLYPKFGIHWSKYAQSLITDSIISYIENQKGIIMPKLEWGPISISDTAREQDYDMGGAMNLLWKLKGYPLAYRNFRTIEDSSDTKPNLIAIGDSYYSSLFSYYLSKNVFTHSQFWFYNKQVYTIEQVKPYPIERINPQEEIEKQDVIFLISTDANLFRFCFGAIDMLYDIYYNPDAYYKAYIWRNKRVEYYISRIKSNDEWRQEVEMKAMQRNIDLEEMIRLDAEYMVELEMEKK